MSSLNKCNPNTNVARKTPSVSSHNVEYMYTSGIQHWMRYGCIQMVSRRIFASFPIIFARPSVSLSWEQLRPSGSWNPSFRIPSTAKKHRHFSNFLRLILSMNPHDEFTTLFYVSVYIGDILTWSIVWDIWDSYPRSDTVESLPSGSMCKQTKGSGGTVYTGWTTTWRQTGTLVLLSKTRAWLSKYRNIMLDVFRWT